MEYNTKELQPPIKYSWLKTLERLKRKGHSLHRISLPATRSALSAYYVVAPAEASSNLAKYDGVRYGMMSYSSSDPSSGEVLYAKTRGRNLGNEVQKRILLGSYSLSAEAVNNYFIRAQKVRRLVQRDFNKAFALSHPLIDEPDHPIAGNGVDVIVTPTTTNDPPLLQDVLGEEAQGDSAAEYKNDVFTVPASLAGLPSLSVPVQEIAGQELKTGMQVIGQYGDDDLVLRLGKDIEAAN